MTYARQRSGHTTDLIVDGLTVELTRKRVRNVNLRVRHDGTVHVSAPAREPIEHIESFVRSKRPWIEAVRSRMERREGVYDLRCVEGTTIYVWGKPLTCHVMETDGLGRARCTVRTKDDSLEVLVRSALSGDDEPSIVARTGAVKAWLRDQLAERIEQLLPTCEATVGRHCSTLRIRDMRSRWGSCNVKTGSVTISLRLVHHEPECLEYVLCHELCHLHEPSHNAHFHALMDQYYPNWQAVRSRLNG